MNAPGDQLLRVDELKVVFGVAQNLLTAVDEVSFNLQKGETLGIVGESGSGKTQIALSVLGLIGGPGRIAQGKVFFKGTDLLTLSQAELRRYRGHQIAMIFQEPMSALNPVIRIGSQMTEPLRYHLGYSRRAARKRCSDLLAEVGIDRPVDCMQSFPHELSGGMRQRVLIATALSCDPEVLIADEPTSALDVTVQAQLLQLLDRIRKQRRLSILFISHDFGVIAQVADRVLVLRKGHILERGTTRSIFNDPQHPYTRALLKASTGALVHEDFGS